MRLLVLHPLVLQPTFVSGQSGLLNSLTAGQDDCACQGSDDRCPTGYTCKESTAGSGPRGCYDAVCPAGSWRCCFGCEYATCEAAGFRKDSLAAGYRPFWFDEQVATGAAVISITPSSTSTRRSRRLKSRGRQLQLVGTTSGSSASSTSGSDAASMAMLSSQLNRQKNNIDHSSVEEEKFVETELFLSFRGVRECLPCRKGDYCPGCDNFHTCPEEQRRDAYGKTYFVPRLSLPNSVFARECIRCPDHYEPDLWLRRCVRSFRRECEMGLLKQCVEDCRWHDECGRHECLMNCARQDDNPECVKAMQETCEELNSRTRAVNLDTSLVAANLVQQTTPAPEFSDDSGLAQVDALEVDYQCNLDCSSAFPLWGTGGSLAALAVIFHLALLHI